MQTTTLLPQRVAAKRKRIKKEGIYGTVFAVLPLVGFVLFSLVPLLIAFYTMFMGMEGYRFDTMHWNGFANFKAAFTDKRFGLSLGISAYVTLGHLIGLVVSLGTSVVLSQKLKGSKFFTVLFFIPYICSSVATAVMWRQMFNGSNGIINEILKFLGSENGIDWMNDPKAYTPMLIIVIAWQAPGYGIVMFTAALTGVNRTLYEAAEIDGAGKWKQFTAITMPAISPTTFYLLLAGIINGLLTFDIARIFTGESWSGAAGPKDMGLTSVLYIYYQGVQFRNMPVASVMSMVLFLIIMVITVINYKLGDKWVSYD